MHHKKYFYLVHLQYLGFRFHGWAKQPDVKSVHGMLDKTLPFVLGHSQFKTMGTSRTDAMVSANHSAFELFLTEPIEDIFAFVNLFNANLPSDIRVIKIEQVDEHFNILNSPKTKTYEYLFAFGEKAHPIGASLMSLFEENLNIERMKEGAKLFVGTHNFGTFCTRPTENTKLIREVLVSEIVENTKYTASFFPQKSYLYRVSAQGFLRNQVRLMMGQLVFLGKGSITLEQLSDMLVQRTEKPLTYIAPASGLVLDKIEFDG